MTRIPFAAMLGLCLLASAAPAADLPPPPATSVKTVTDTYFGTQVADPYRWLENMQGSQFKTWLKAQADYADGVLARIPGREALKKRIDELSNAGTVVQGMRLAGGRGFYLKTEPGRNGRQLYVGGDGHERLLLDPDTLPSSGPHYAIDWYSPSPDGKLIAIGVSQGGSEDSELRLYDLTTDTWLDERIDRTGLNENGVGWLPDGKRFFYNRLPAADANGKRERYDKSAVWLHTVGLPAAKDIPMLGYGLDAKRRFDEADIVTLTVARGAHFVLAQIEHGDAIERSYYIAPLDKLEGIATPWRRIVSPDDQVARAWQHGDTLYLLSNQKAPHGKLLALDLNKPDLKTAKVVMPPARGILRDAEAGQDALYIKLGDGEIDKLIQLPYGGRPIAITLPVGGTLREIAVSDDGPDVLVKLEGWTESPRYVAVDGKTGRAHETAIMAKSPVSFADAETRRMIVRSHDGAQVPLSIIMLRGAKLDGSHPTQLSGYGAYGMVMEPRFSAASKAWLEQGGILATCHVRGGGEFGEEWHRAGFIQTKANTAKDFIACADYLVKEGYTSPAKLAGRAGSAGGITIGGAITARPELFAAANSAVGVSDLLRMELTSNGPSNIAEFGTVTKEADFRAMLANSPYHRIQNGVAYPAVIVTTGANDPRVDTWMPAKLAARLQAATSSHKPVILRVDYDGGHGIGSTKAQQVAETADVWSFFLWQMGVPAFQPKD